MKRNPIFTEGFDACKNNSSRDSCPYRVGTHNHKSWNKGYDWYLFGDAETLNKIEITAINE